MAMDLPSCKFSKIHDEDGKGDQNLQQDNSIFLSHQTLLLQPNKIKQKTWLTTVAVVVIAVRKIKTLNCIFSAQKMLNNELEWQLCQCGNIVGVVVALSFIDLHLA